MDNGASSYHRFLDGDDNGFIEIVRDYKDGLILYLNSFTNNIHVAEDTFVKLGIKKPKDSGKASFKTWLYTIGRNIAIDYIRHNSKHIEVSMEENQSQINDEKSLEDAYIHNEQKIALHRTLHKLKSEYKQVLWLIYFEGFNNKETARIMKKSVHNIETLVYRARQSLKTEISKEDFVYEDL